MLPSGARFHYSNLAFALLGIVVERVSGLPYQDYLRERLFEPVGLTRVSFEPEPPAAKGYLAQPYADGVWDTIGVETGAWASAGQLWATAGDICRWGAFLADPDESVLARGERRGDADGAGDRRPRALAVGLRARPRAAAGRRPDPRRPRRLDARIHRDARLLGDGEGRRRRRSRTRARRTSASSESRFWATTVEEWPVAPETWRIGEPPPDDVVPLLGIWFMEAARVVFRWREGKLEARFDGTPDWRPSSVFERETDDRWRTVSGPEHGEALRIVRAEDGSVERMVWAGYPVTREPGPWQAPD